VWRFDGKAENSQKLMVAAAAAAAADRFYVNDSGNTISIKANQKHISTHKRLFRGMLIARTESCTTCSA
jgi:hypothetical protein